MTENAVVQWDPNSGAALPAYLQDAMGGLGTNIADRMSVPSLSYEGKTWTIVKDGNKTKLQSQNGDGDMVPIPVMRMIVLNYNPERGRAYYPGVYNPAESKQPDCWSADGKAPDPGCSNKQSTACNGCPMSIKGSKVQDGKEMVACSSHRMIAIAPAFEINSDPLRLKIAVTSDWDKTVVEHGWFAFNQYTDFLKSRGITHTALVVTKVKFDPNTAYPKLLFAIDRLLTQAEVAEVQQALQNPKVAELLAEKWSAAGTNGQLTDQSDTSPGGLEAAYADGWTAHPDSAGWSYKGDQVMENDKLAALYPKPEAPKEEPKAPPPIPASQQVIDQTPATPAERPAEVPAEKPVLGGLAAAVADGWIVHPQAPGYHYRGEEVVADADLEARYPSAPPVAAAPPPPPPAAPAPEPEVSPADKAAADGWLAHPQSPPHMYRGEEVKTIEEVLAMYAGNAASAPAAPASENSAAATPAASPSSPAPAGTAEIPSDVQDLLNKWA